MQSGTDDSDLTQSPPDALSPPTDHAPVTAPSERVLLHMPVDVRSISLAILAAVPCVFMLQWGKAVFVPLLLGLIFSYALAPLVNRLEGLRLPRALGAALSLIHI